MIGTVLLNRYRLDAELGRGGMGEVYRATDTLTGDLVAVKALNRQVIAQDPALLERFVREGEALRRLNHPNIVRMVAAVQEQEQHYLVIEYVKGGSLDAVLAAHGRLPSKRVLEIALEVADALTRAHHLGIIHRDLKPANLLLAEDGTPRLADFGIAHVESKQHLTQTGVLMGTIDYLSPEVCQGKPPDERADIWAFGVMLFEMLSGRLPFEGDSLTARLTAILTQPVPDLAQLAPDAPNALIDLVYRMLDKDPQQRIPSVRLVGAELEAMLKGREPVTPPRVTPAPSANVHAPRHNLPTQLSKFIGREKEIAQVKQLLTGTGGDVPPRRLVTLTGSGGIGKTRLAIQVGREVLPLYPHGVWLIELAPLADPALVPQAIMTTFDLPEDARRSPLTVLTDYFREKTALLVLDNCEHVIDACAQLTEHLLMQCPDLCVLTSSREALGIEGETALRVPSLSLPPVDTSTREALNQSEAAQLFFDRAAIALPGLALTDANAPAVAQICRRLDGIALAIELAAGRVKLLKVEQIAARLDDTFRLLTGGSRTALPRQQTLRATIDWSYNLLSAAERALLRRLAVFAGSGTLEAIETVCAGNGLEEYDVLDTLTQLVNKSLAMAERGQGDEARYYLLETVRQYAREKLNDSGEGQAVRERHTRWCVELAERAEPKLRGHGQLEWLDRIEQEHDNLRAALEWSLNNNVELGLQVASALTWFWDIRCHAVEGLQHMEKLLAAGPRGPSLLRARALARASWVAMIARNEERMVALAKAGAAMSRELDYPEGLALSLCLSAISPYWHGDYDRALPLAEESLVLFEEAGIPWGKQRVLSGVGYITQAQGNYERARAAYQESLALSRESGDINFVVFLLNLLGGLAFEQGYYEQAMALFQESLSLAREVKNYNMIAEDVQSMGEVYIVLGQYPQARTLLEESIALDREVGNYRRQAWVLNLLGRVARLQGEYEQAANIYMEGLQLAQKYGWRATMAWSLAGLAELVALRDQPKKAARLLAAAEAIPELYIGQWPYERLELEQISGMIHAQLDGAIFQAEQEAGRQMTLDDAIAYALEETTK